MKFDESVCIINTNFTDLLTNIAMINIFPAVAMKSCILLA